MSSPEAVAAPAGTGLPRWLALIAAVIVLDQISKAWMLAAFAPYATQEVAGFFNLVLVFNSGAAFSFLAGAGGWQKWFFVVLAFGVSAWLLALLRAHAGERLLPAALALIVGGALGNVIDRLRFDAVVDFIQVHYAGWYFPAFNVADSAITVGVGLMLLHQLRYGGEPR